MNMRLNEPGDYSTAASVDQRVSCLSGATNLSDAFVADEQITTHDGIRRIHRDECSVPDEDRRH
jgi:hypothetical protein